MTALPFSNRNYFDIIGFSALLLIAGCSGVTHPVLCVSVGPVSKKDVANIRSFGRELASTSGAELVDVSERYKTRAVGPELSVGLTVKTRQAEMTMLSAGTLTPIACFYGDSKASELQRLVEIAVDGLARLNLSMKMENARQLGDFPPSLQAKIAAVITPKKLGRP